MSQKPNVYIFNPTSEMAVANGTVSWQPNLLLQQFENDLETIPAYLALASDYVIVRNVPDVDFYASFRNIDIEFPKFIDFKNLENSLTESTQNIERIIPWGWSQVVHRQFKSIIPKCSIEFCEGVFGKWNPSLKLFMSREFAKDILVQFVGEQNDLFIPHSDLPQKCLTIQSLEKFHKINGQSVVKMPWSSSGRGLQIINQKNIHPSIINRLRGALKQQGFLMIEPLLDKKLDFATHFKISKKGIEFIGKSIFNTSSDGKYIGNYLCGYSPRNQETYSNFLEQNMEDIVTPLLLILEKSNLKSNYYGYFGIDGMVYQQNGELKIQPCLEINLRHNMGLLSLKLEELIDDGSYAILNQIHGSYEEFKSLYQEVNTNEIVKGKIQRGLLPLVPINIGQRFIAYLEVYRK